MKNSHYSNMMENRALGLPGMRKESTMTMPDTTRLLGQYGNHAVIIFRKSSWKRIANPKHLCRLAKRRASPPRNPSHVATAAKRRMRRMRTANPAPIYDLSNWSLPSVVRSPKRSKKSKKHRHRKDSSDEDSEDSNGQGKLKVEQVMRERHLDWAEIEGGGLVATMCDTLMVNEKRIKEWCK